MMYALVASAFEETDMEALVAAETPEEEREVLAGVLNFDVSVPADLCSCLLMHRVYRFAVDAGFTAKQISALISIVKYVHEKGISENATAASNFAVFSEMLCSYSVHRPPYSTGLWSARQLTRISDWMLAEYYTQYQLFGAICRPRVVLNMSTRENNMTETPPSLSPLSSAITEETFLQRQEKERASERQREAEEKLHLTISSLPEGTQETIHSYIDQRIQEKLATMPQPTQDLSNRDSDLTSL